MQTNEQSAQAAPVVIAEFEKNKKEKVRVSFVEFQGHELLEVRAFYPASDGTMKPGKGLCIQRAQITTLRKALQEAERAMRDKKTAVSPEHEPEESAESLAEAA